MSRGDDLRSAIESEYEIQGVAATTMVDAIVRTAEELEAFEAVLDEDGPVVTGARGQKTANPAATLVAKHRALLSRLLQDAFPDSHESDVEKKQRAARAANAKIRGARR